MSIFWVFLLEIKHIKQQWQKKVFLCPILFPWLCYVTRLVSWTSTNSDDGWRRFSLGRSLRGDALENLASKPYPTGVRCCDTLSKHMWYRLQIKGLFYSISVKSYWKLQFKGCPRVSTGRRTIINVFHVQNLSQTLHNLQHKERAWSYRLAEP